MSYPGSSLATSLLLSRCIRSVVVSGTPADFIDNPAQHHEGEEDERRTDNGFSVETHADSRTDSGNDPEGRGGRQSDDGRTVLFEQDRAGSEEADSGDDLGGDTRRIETLQIGEEIDRADRNQGEQTGTHTDHDVGAESRRLAVEFALHVMSSRGALSLELVAGV